MSDFEIADPAVACNVPTPEPIETEPKRKEVTAAAFVLAWMNNDSLNGVAEAVGLSTQACRARAEKYRKEGLMLPPKVRGKKQEKIDVKALNELIAELQVTK